MLSDRWGDAPQEIAEQLDMAAIREKRNRLLVETDWTQLSDIPETTKAQWVTYRQALRDITDTYTSLDDVVWPTKPS